jgi:hypothetical protein
MNIQVTLSPFGPDILQNGVIGKFRHDTQLI